MGHLTTQSSDTPSLGNLLDEVGNFLTDDIPTDAVASSAPGRRLYYVAFSMSILLALALALIAGEVM